MTTAINSARILAIYLQPVIPKISENIFQFLSLNSKIQFSELEKILENVEILPYQMLSQRVDEKAITMMLEENKESQKDETKAQPVNQKTEKMAKELSEKSNLKNSIEEMKSALEELRKKVAGIKTAERTAKPIKRPL